MKLRIFCIGGILDQGDFVSVKILSVGFFFNALKSIQLTYFLFKYELFAGTLLSF